MNKNSQFTFSRNFLSFAFCNFERKQKKQMATNKNAQLRYKVQIPVILTT